MKEKQPLKNSNRNINDVPLVSIVCMTYNQKEYIGKTLDGFLSQELSFPVEIVVHDDASTDGTSDIIREYERKYDGKFKPIYQTENQYSKKVGIGRTFIYPYLKGKYVALCEGDDYWIDPLKLQKQVDFLEQNEEYGLVYTEIERVNEKDEVIDRNFFKNDPASFCETFDDYLIHSPFRAPCTWLFRRNLYIKREKRYVVGDLPMLLDIVAHSKIHKLEDITARYRVLTNSASHFTKITTTYSFLKGIYQVQMDYALLYNVSDDVVKAIRVKHALTSYNFAVSEHDIDQIKEANKIVIGHPEVTYKFKVIQLLSKFKFGRNLVRYRLNRILGYN